MARNLLKRAIPFDVVGDEDSAGAQTTQRHFKLPFHMGVGVQAVMDENIYAARITEDGWEEPLGGPTVQFPPLAELARNEIANITFCIAGQRRQVDTVQLTPIVFLKSLEDISGSHTVSYAGLYDGLRAQVTASAEAELA